MQYRIVQAARLLICKVVKLTTVSLEVDDSALKTFFEAIAFGPFINSFSSEKILLQENYCKYWKFL